MFRQRKIRYFSISKFTIFLSNACGNAGGICKSRKGGEEELYSVLYSASQQCPAPGKASPALHWATLSRRQLCASQHLFVSGCQEIMDWDVVTFISLIVTPCEIVKCDKRERQESRSRDSCLLLGPRLCLSFFRRQQKFVESKAITQESDPSLSINQYQSKFLLHFIRTQRHFATLHNMHFTIFHTKHAMGNTLSNINMKHDTDTWSCFIQLKCVTCEGGGGHRMRGTDV